MQMSFLFTSGGFLLCSALWAMFEDNLLGCIALLVLSLIAIGSGIIKDINEIKNGLKNKER